MDFPSFTSLRYLLYVENVMIIFSVIIALLMKLCQFLDCDNNEAQQLHHHPLNLEPCGCKVEQKPKP